MIGVNFVFRKYAHTTNVQCNVLTSTWIFTFWGIIFLFSSFFYARNSYYSRNEHWRIQGGFIARPDFLAPCWWIYSSVWQNMRSARMFLDQFYTCIHFIYHTYVGPVILSVGSSFVRMNLVGVCLIADDRSVDEHHYS